jgi:hypothetical protein
MQLPTLSSIVFYPISLAFPQIPYPNHAFKLPKHPSNWICTVHITTATFSNYTSSDVIERILTSNREMIIPTLSTMDNRSISITPVNSFFEPCTISILVDATVNRSSYILRENEIPIYIQANKYVHRGWRHSIIIVIRFSCSTQFSTRSRVLPHRLCYHSLECGPQNIFPNCVFVPNPLVRFMTIEDPTHNIHDRKLPSEIRRLLFRPIYSLDRNPNAKSKDCLNTRWIESPIRPCLLQDFAVDHFQHFLNFTVVNYTRDNLNRYGAVFMNQILTNTKHPILLHAIGSIRDRIMYCDRNLDAPRLRPINISSPFSSRTWAILALLLILTRERRDMSIVEIHTKYIFRFRMYYFIYEIFIPSLHFDPKIKSSGGL